MPTNPLPPREPIGDWIEAHLIEHKRRFFLISTLPETSISTAGRLLIRYGIRFLGKPHLSIVPGMLALDYGDLLTGERMMKFILTKASRYPRADVIGYRNNGTDDMLPLKTLDVDIPLDILAYPDTDATTPLASIAALIGAETDFAHFPQRIRDNLTRFETLSAWEAAHPTL